MPDLSADVIKDLEERLIKFLSPKGKYEQPCFLAAGGSAAVFKVVGSEGGLKAFKVFDPRFISSDSNSADKRRLNIQNQLIGHDCIYLVQMFAVEQFEGTAFIEMEFIDWPQLSKQLEKVPDDKVANLISQLVEVVKFLEVRGIVHRDIKPENIHVSPDFENLKLLDLGVARELETDSDAADTDNGNLRPFLATAQYSSPEYLFRLDPPSTKLWQGLNFYQIGAVLHDLIMKKPLFHEEVQLGNRWLVAKAVLIHTPSFSGGSANLQNLKILASRCLSKDLDLRLSLVGWSDFVFEGAVDPLISLRGRISRLSSQNVSVSDTQNTKLKFDRNAFCKRIMDGIRNKLIPICGGVLPLSTQEVSNDNFNCVCLFFSPEGKNVKVQCILKFEWLTGLQVKTAVIHLSAKFVKAEVNHCQDDHISKIIMEATLNVSEDLLVEAIAKEVASALERALNQLDTNDSNMNDNQQSLLTNLD